MGHIKKSANYDVILIGAGISSLVCASLLARKDLKVLVIEQHIKPGGYITSYKRRGFHFDVPHVVGNVNNGLFNLITEKLGIKEDITFNNVDLWQKWIYPDMEIKVPSDTKGLIHELAKYFPEEKKGLDKLFSAMRRISQQNQEMHKPGFFKKIFQPLFFRDIYFNSTKTFKIFLDGYLKNENLKVILSSSWGYLGMPPEELTAITMSCMLSSYLEGGAWYPEYGFQYVADTFANRIKELGGDFIFKTEVNKILVEDNTIIGVETKDKEKFLSKYVISGIDLKKTFLNLLDEEHLGSDFIKKIRNIKSSSSGISVHIGTDMDLSKYDLQYGTIMLSQNYDITSYFYNLYDNHNIYDAGNIPIGISVPSLLSDKINKTGFHSVDILGILPNYHAWKSIFINEGKEKYNEMKERYADLLIKSAEKVIPGLSDNIIMKEVASPLTYERYTHATDGAWYDIAPIVSQSSRNRLSVRGPIKNFYLIGAKILGGGMMPSSVSGFLAAQHILRGSALND